MRVDFNEKRQSRLDGGFVEEDCKEIGGEGLWVRLREMLNRLNRNLDLCSFLGLLEDRNFPSASVSV